METQNDEKKETVEAYELVAKANLAAERMEKANKEMERLLATQQKAQVVNMLGGKSVAAEPPVEKVESPRDYMKRVMRNEI